MRHYRVTKWRTLISIFQDNIRTLMQEEAFQKQVSNNFIDNLGERWRELQRTQYRLIFILFSLIIFIGTLGSGMTESIVIFGVRLSNQNASLAILMLLSSVLMFTISTLGLLSNQYEALIKSSINSLMDEEVGKYYIQ